MKLCKDCKYIITHSFKEGPSWRQEIKEPLCDHPNACHSRVDGRPLEECEKLRVIGFTLSETLTKNCGPLAYWFEPKELAAIPRQWRA